MIALRTPCCRRRHVAYSLLFPLVMTLALIGKPSRL
jgi:hypothetical protein